MSFFDEFERSYTGDQNKKDKKSRNERKEQDRQMETEQKQRRDRNDPYSDLFATRKRRPMGLLFHVI